MGSPAADAQGRRRARRRVLAANPAHTETGVCGESSNRDWNGVFILPNQGRAGAGVRRRAGAPGTRGDWKDCLVNAGFRQRTAVPQRSAADRKVRPARPKKPAPPKRRLGPRATADPSAGSPKDCPRTFCSPRLPETRRRGRSACLPQGAGVPWNPGFQGAGRLERSCPCSQAAGTASLSRSTLCPRRRETGKFACRCIKTPTNRRSPCPSKLPVPPPPIP